MARGACGGYGSGKFAGSCRGVGGNCSGARRSAPDLSAHPGTRCFDGFARPVISRAFPLETEKNMFGTQGSPEGKGALIKSSESAGV